VLHATSTAADLTLSRLDLKLKLRVRRWAPEYNPIFVLYLGINILTNESH
jgi:hypothetical protein